MNNLHCGDGTPGPEQYYSGQMIEYSTIWPEKYEVSASSINMSRGLFLTTDCMGILGSLYRELGGIIGSVYGISKDNIVSIL